MIKLRKILAIIYLLSFVLLAAGLTMFWFSVDPVASFMQSYRNDTMLNYLIWTMLGVTTIGTVGYVIRTIAQRGKNTFQKSSNELGSVQISRAAIVREVNNAMSSHPEVKHLKTNVTIKNRRRHPYANINIRLAPRGSLNMPAVTASIQRDVKEAVMRLTGNEVRKVSIEVRRNSDKDDHDASIAEEVVDARTHELEQTAFLNAVGESLNEAIEKQVEESRQILGEYSATEEASSASSDESLAIEGEAERPAAISGAEETMRSETEDVDDTSDSKE